MQPFQYWKPFFKRMIIWKDMIKHIQSSFWDFRTDVKSITMHWKYVSILTTNKGIDMILMTKKDFSTIFTFPKTAFQKNKYLKRYI